MKYLSLAFALFFLLGSLGCTRDDDSLPIIVTVETDKSIYAESDTVFFALYVTNYGLHPIDLFALNHPVADIWILKNYSFIWKWKSPYEWPATWDFTLAPGETLVIGEESEYSYLRYNFYWLQDYYDESTISGPDKVPRGTYQVIGILDTEPQYTSEKVTIELR